MIQIALSNLWVEMKYGTSNPQQIDIITKEDGLLTLHLVQSIDVDEDNIFQLQEKINFYLMYILDGQLDEKYPDYSHKPARIEMKFQFEPSGIAKKFIEKAVKLCAPKNIQVNINVG